MKHSKMANRLTRLLAIMLAIIMLTGVLAGCSDKNGGTSNSGNNNGTTATPDEELPEIISETIRIPEQPAPFVAQQNVTALAAQQYVTARLYLDALIEFDWDTGTVEKFAELYDDTIEQFELAEEYAALAIVAAKIAQMGIDAEIKVSGMAHNQGQSVGVSLLSYRPGGGNPFVLTALAAEPPKGADELRAWAKDVEKTANDASQMYGEKGVVGTLAKQLGVDSKTAGEMLKQAKTINEGAAAESSAFWWGLGGDAADFGMKTAMATKSTCKVALVVTSAIATGGATTALGATALVVSGADCIIEVGMTASTIIYGENHSATAAWGLAQDVIAPVSAALGLITLDFSKSAGIIGYIGNSLIDLPEGKVMGVTMESAETLNAITFMAYSYVTTGEAIPKREIEIKKISEQLNESRVKQGLPPIPETPPEAKPPLEKAKETVPKTPVKSVLEYISELIDWMEENGYVSPEFAEELRTKYLGAGNFEGTYNGTYDSITVGIEETPGTSSGNSTIEVLLSDEASNTYTVKYIDQMNVYTFSGQIINRQFQSSDVSVANQYHEVVNSTTLSLDFSETGDSLSGTMVRLGTLNGLSFTQTRTINMTKQ